MPPHAQLVRLKINSIQLKETRAEVDATHEKVVQDRVYQLDATLVRIMKARKTLTHPQLVAEALAQLRFPAKVMGGGLSLSRFLLLYHSGDRCCPRPDARPLLTMRSPRTSRRASTRSSSATTLSATRRTATRTCTSPEEAGSTE